ncbi:MAG: S9 family peptidase [Gemmatimonadetes bacterium]|nr:S9 family peptidase [Gemmatimonadota bacterium]
MMQACLAAACAALVVPNPVSAQQRRALTFDDLAGVEQVADPSLSADGRFVLYVVRVTDLAGNRRVATTYVQPVAGGDARAFPDDTTRATEARWSPDGQRVAYVARGQLWVANADGTGRRKLTQLTGGATGPVWSPNGQQLALTSGVYPACRDEACNADKAAKAEASKVKAHVTDGLMYRHWNQWDDGTRSHLFVVGLDGGAPVDLVPGATYDVPPGPFGGSEGYAWSPDGRELAFTAKLDTQTQAWSTDVNIYTIAASGGTPLNRTPNAKGADQNPVYAPDGKAIYYVSQRRAGFEADKWRLMRLDRATGASVELLPQWDRSTDAIVPLADGSALLLGAQDRGRTAFFRIALKADGMAAAATPTPLVLDGHNGALGLGANGTLAWTHDDAQHPAEVWTGKLGAGGVTEARAITRRNVVRLAGVDLPALEPFGFKGAKGDSVLGWVLKPANYVSGKKYPAILLIHGGPQGAWFDQWHGRWNYQMFAATGAGLVIINPRGSTGYGQRFTDEISKDWGGKVVTDLMNGLDAAIARNAWIDTAHLGATGGSYGGYMTNWLAGHSTRFKALVTHAGVFNLEAMAGATEEQWFTDWEFGGTWWNATAMQQQYRKWSPHLAAGKFRTPMLVMHGEQDFRVPINEGLSLFTALQRQGVPSRMVVFPDEGHWIGKPQNQQLWWKEMQGWFTRYLMGDRPLP